MDAGERGSASGGESSSSPAEAWLYSVLSATLVGFSGVFPLLVIPLDAGPGLRHGPGAARLKLLLSFAVGGLLGDVFLHLLPEAWAGIGLKDPNEDVHQEMIKVGLMVIGGFLLFLIIEKTFGSEEDLQPLPDTCEDSSTDHDQSDAEEDSTSELAKSSSHDNADTVTDASCHRSNGVVSNGLSSNGKCNGSIANGNLRHRSTKEEQDSGTGTDPKAKKATRKAEDKSKKNTTQSGHIKITGYLNLVANCIDNFTHGLAVAGSYLVSTKMGVCTTIAILLHEIPHEVGDFAILLRSGFDRWGAAKAQVWTAAGGLTGALAALAADSAASFGDATAWILPFTAGGFLYIALVTVVPDIIREKHPWESLKQIVCLVSGILALLAVTYLFD